MKRFEIITEADARLLDYGETVELARGGHVTPLAQDTLRERRVTLAEEGRTPPDEASLAPRASIRTLAIGSVADGNALRQGLMRMLRGRALTVEDLGTDATNPGEYPDVAAGVARLVACGAVDAGIVIDGTGIGSAIAANKIAGARAVMATTELIARKSRQESGANVLTLGSELVTLEMATAIVSAWLATPMRDREHIRRLARVRDLEK